MIEAALQLITSSLGGDIKLPSTFWVVFPPPSFTFSPTNSIPLINCNRVRWYQICHTLFTFLVTSDGIAIAAIFILLLYFIKNKFNQFLKLMILENINRDKQLTIISQSNVVLISFCYINMLHYFYFKNINLRLMNIS